MQAGGEDCVIRSSMGDRSTPQPFPFRDYHIGATAFACTAPLRPCCPMVQVEVDGNNRPRQSTRSSFGGYLGDTPGQTPCRGRSCSGIASSDDYRFSGSVHARQVLVYLCMNGRFQLRARMCQKVGSERRSPNKATTRDLELFSW